MLRKIMFKMIHPYDCWKDRNVEMRYDVNQIQVSNSRLLILLCEISVTYCVKEGNWKEEGS